MAFIDTQRFAGFSRLYDSARPRPSSQVVDVVLQYLRKDKAGQVVDLGSGTGLSTAVWRGRCDRVVGVEPTADMRLQAQANHPDLGFVEGSSYATGLPTAFADVVTCSQSFHWMEPAATLAEVDRILVPQGVFAVYDCTWPVAWDWEAEAAYRVLFQRVDDLLGTRPGLTTDDTGFPKSRHRANLEASGRFEFVTELGLSHTEACDADRFLAIALSQGQVQKLVKAGVSELNPAIDEFQALCRRSTRTTMRVTYNLVIGVKLTPVIQ